VTLSEFAHLFDGSERQISVEVIVWYVREVFNLRSICPIAVTSSSKAGTSSGKTPLRPMPTISPNGSEAVIARFEGAGLV
jgi:hypothetical protein